MRESAPFLHDSRTPYPGRPLLLPHSDSLSSPCHRFRNMVENYRDACAPNFPARQAAGVKTDGSGSAARLSGAFLLHASRIETCFSSANYDGQVLDDTLRLLFLRGVIIALSLALLRCRLYYMGASGFVDISSFLFPPFSTRSLPEFSFNS